MSETSPLTRSEIGAIIAQKAWKDETFHREVLADPSKVYEKHLGRPLPPGMTIKIIEDTPNTVHFVIPARPPAPGELSDAELEGVAGGATPLVSLLTAGVFFSVTAVAGVQTKSGGW
jgi:hypothetical protein